MIEDLDKTKEIERKIRKGDIGEKRKKLNHNYYVRKSIVLKDKVKNRRRKVPPPIFEYRNNKLIEYFGIQHIARDLGMSLAGVRSLESKGVIMKTPFKGKQRGGGHDRLYTREQREMIKNCFDAARAVCGVRNYTAKFKQLLKSKWIEAEIAGVW